MYIQLHAVLNCQGWNDFLHYLRFEWDPVIHQCHFSNIISGQGVVYGQPSLYQRVGRLQVGMARTIHGCNTLQKLILGTFLSFIDTVIHLSSSLEPVKIKQSKESSGLHSGGLKISVINKILSVSV